MAVRSALVEKVAEGRSGSSKPDLGKKLTLNINGKTQTEDSDLVLWTAGVLCNSKHTQRTNTFFC